MDLGKLTAMAREEAPELVEKLRWLHDVSLYEAVSGDGGEAEGVHDSPITGAQVRQLVADGMVGEFHGMAKRRVKVFLRAEEAKMAWRVLGWPRQLNEEMLSAGWESGMWVPTIGDNVEGVHAGAWGLCMDMKKGFYQFALSDAVQAFFVFTVEGTEYAWRRLVMGFRPAAELCNDVLGMLARKAARGVPGVRATFVHVDNARFVGCRVGVVKARVRLRALAKEVGMTFGVEAENEPHKVGRYCGVVYDYRGKTVCLTEAAVGKLRLLRASLIPGGIPFKAMRVLMGRLFHAAVVTQAPVARWYYAIKWYRRRCRGFSRGEFREGDTVGWWKDAWEQVGEWLDHCIRNVPVVPRNPQAVVHWHLFTDASLQGAGGVLVNSYGEIRTVGARWVDIGPWTGGWVPSINQLEMVAVGWALGQFRREIGYAPVWLSVDNTSVISTMRRGRSGAFWLNRYFREVADLGFDVVKVDYVASAQNPADHPSRHF